MTRRMGGAVDIREEFAWAYRRRRDAGIYRGELAWHDVAKSVAGTCATFLATGRLDDNARELAALYARIKELASGRNARRAERAA